MLFMSLMDKPKSERSEGCNGPCAPFINILECNVLLLLNVAHSYPTTGRCCHTTHCCFRCSPVWSLLLQLVCLCIETCLSQGLQQHGPCRSLALTPLAKNTVKSLIDIMLVALKYLVHCFIWDVEEGGHCPPLTSHLWTNLRTKVSLSGARLQEG